MPSRCQPDFEPLLAELFSMAALDQTQAPVIGLRSDGRLAYLNEAWDDFATVNGGQPDIARHWDLDSNYFRAIPAALTPFYRELFGRAPAPGAGLQPVSHEYECSGARVFRKFNMQVFALSDHAGFLVLNSMIVERPHDPATLPEHPDDLALYADETGTIHQCSHFRRVQSNGHPDRWDWVPAWVESIPPETSHTICPICYEYYYPLGGRHRVAASSSGA